MCYDVKKFLNFRQLDAAKEITLGNGYSVKLGIGTIEQNVKVLD